MTPEETSRNILSNCPDLSMVCGEDLLALAIEVAIRQAVFAEREACAKLAECEYDYFLPHAIKFAKRIAKAIRERSGSL